MPTRVLIMGLGPIGAGVARRLHARRSFKVVAAVDIDPAKAGRDLGEVLGTERPTGVKVSADVASAIRKAKPQAAVLCTSSSLQAVWPQLEAVLKLRVPIVSTTEELSYPWFSNRRLARKIDAAAKKAKVAVVGTGVNPGFAMERAAHRAHSRSASAVNAVRIERIEDARIRRLPFQQKIGSGLTPEQFAEKVKDLSVRHVGLTESVAMIADALGFEIDRITDEIQPKIAREPVESRFLKVPAGRVCGLVQDGIGYVDGEPRIALHMEAYLGAPEDVRSRRGRGFAAARRPRRRRLPRRRGDGLDHGQQHLQLAARDTRASHDAKPGAAVVRRRPARPEPPHAAPRLPGNDGRRDARRGHAWRSDGGRGCRVRRRPKTPWAPAAGRPRGAGRPRKSDLLSVDVEIAQDVVRAFSLEPRLGAHVRE